MDAEAKQLCVIYMFVDYSRDTAIVYFIPRKTSRSTWHSLEPIDNNNATGRAKKEKNAEDKYTRGRDTRILRLKLSETEKKENWRNGKDQERGVRWSEMGR